MYINTFICTFSSVIFGCILLCLFLFALFSGYWQFSIVRCAHAEIRLLQWVLQFRQLKNQFSHKHTHIMSSRLDRLTYRQTLILTIWCNWRYIYWYDLALLFGTKIIWNEEKFTKRYRIHNSSISSHPSHRPMYTILSQSVVCVRYSQY